jgi:hypothetical protein
MGRRSRLFQKGGRVCLFKAGAKDDRPINVTRKLAPKKRGSMLQMQLRLALVNGFNRA